jgi:hypothetical protein
MNFYGTFLPHGAATQASHYDAFCSPSQGLSFQHLDARTPQILRRVQDEFVMRHSTGAPQSTHATWTCYRWLHFHHECRGADTRQERLAAPRLLQIDQSSPTEVKRLPPRATGLVRGCNTFSPYAGRVSLHHLNRKRLHHLCLPAG